MIDPTCFVHQSSYVDENVSIGRGSKIWHFCHIQGGAFIGEHCILGQNVNVGPNVVIGNNVKIQNNVSVYQGVTLEDDVFVGPSAVFTNVLNPRSFVNRKEEFRPTLVKRGASIGANAVIVCGHTIGEYAFVGAGAVVTKDVPKHHMVVGCPAELLYYVCRCGSRLMPEFSIGDTGRISVGFGPKVIKSALHEGIRWACPSCNTVYLKKIDIDLEVLEH